MKSLAMLAFCLGAAAQQCVAAPERAAYDPLPLGSVEPKGWIREQLANDAIDGMAGHFIELRPQYGSKSWINKDGNLAAGEMGGNWLDGYIRMAYLTGLPAAKTQADDFVRDLLGARDDDGYIGNVKPDRRYQNRMTGELWMQSRIYVALLAYYEFTGDRTVLEAVSAATRLTMKAYGPANSPFHLTVAERTIARNGRIRTVEGHGLMFVDVLEWLYRLTGDRSYPAFARFLYEDFSSSDDIDTRDIQIRSLQSMKYPFFWHGVHTAEHLRVPLFLAYADESRPFSQLTENALAKLAKHIVSSGSMASDEGVMNHTPLPDQPYEYCVTTELATSLESVLQKTGRTKYADMIERAVFNAAQGARTPDGKCVAYLSSATLPSAMEDHDIPYAGKKRHKLSPAHDVGGACCSANAVKILPYYTSAMWMKSGQGEGLAALLFGPSHVQAAVRGVRVTIDEATAYPFSDTITFTVTAESPVNFPLTIRVPEWANEARLTALGAEITAGDGIRTITKTWQTGDTVTVEFETPIRIQEQTNGEISVFRGPLLFVYSWPSKLVPLQSQKFNVPGFAEYNVVPITAYSTSGLYADVGEKDLGLVVRRNPKGSELTPWASPPLTLTGDFHTYHRDDGYRKRVTLVPMGATLLRFASFQIWPFDGQYFEARK